MLENGIYIIRCSMAAGLLDRETCQPVLALPATWAEAYATGYKSGWLHHCPVTYYMKAQETQTEYTYSLTNKNTTMKKANLALAVIMTAAASCSEQGAIEITENEDCMYEMTFSTFSDKFTKGTPDYSASAGNTGLAMHHKSFKVIASKFAGDPSFVYPVSEPGTVTYNESTGQWTASPARYWDMNSTDYHFFAAAPANPGGSGWNFIMNTDKKTDTYMKVGAVSVNNIQLKGENSVTTPVDSLSPVWSGTQDLDLMISKDCHVTKSSSTYGASTPAPVNLEFFHILTRFTVMVKKSVEITDSVSLIKLEFRNLKDKGNFDEANRSSVTDYINSSSRWASSRANSSYTLSSCSYDNVSETARYVIGSLIIPQSVGFESLGLDGTLTETQVAVGSSDKPYMYVEYSIDGQTFYGYYNLSKLMNSDNSFDFKEGYNYNITINIAPKNLSFNCNTYNWPSAEERTLTSN